MNAVELIAIAQAQLEVYRQFPLARKVVHIGGTCTTGRSARKPYFCVVFDGFSESVWNPPLSASSMMHKSFNLLVF